MPYSERTSVRGHYFYYVALFDILGEIGDGSGEHPRVEPQERLFFASLEGYGFMVLHI